MHKRWSEYAKAILRAGLTFTALVTPVVFASNKGSSIFETPKTTAIKVGASIVLLGQGGSACRKTPGLLLTLTSWILSTVFSSNWRGSLGGSYNRRQGLLTIIDYLILHGGAKRSRAWINPLLIAGGIVAAYSFVQKLGKDWVKWNVDNKTRPASTMGNADYYPHLLIMLIPLALRRFLSARYWERKLAWLLYAGGLILSVAISRTRGAYLGLAAGLISFGSTVSREDVRINKGWLFALGCLLLPFWQKFVKFIKSINWKNNRFLIWKAGIKAWLKRPILGWGNDAGRVPITREKEVALVLREGWCSYDRTHNQYIDDLVLRGVFGFTANMILLTNFFLEWRKSSSTEVKALGAGIIAYLTQNTVAFTTSTTGMAFWLLLGGIYANDKH